MKLIARRAQLSTPKPVLSCAMRCLKTALRSNTLAKNPAPVPPVTSSSAIAFVGGVGSAKNVYWRVGGATSIAANSTFIGNIFDHVTIAVLSGANVTGSLFSTTGSVTLIADTITKP